MMTAMYLNLLDIGTVTKPVMQFYRIYEVLCSVDKWIFIWMSSMVLWVLDEFSVWLQIAHLLDVVAL